MPSKLKSIRFVTDAERRAAYDKAAREADRPLSEWIRHALDKAAGYVPKCPSRKSRGTT